MPNPNPRLEAAAKNWSDIEEQYARFVNPQWVKLLTALGLNKRFVRSVGAELFTDEGETYVDFLSGYGVYALGHSHPYVTQQLIEELQSQRPSMLQSHIPALAGQLAERLCTLAGPKLEKVYFGSSGSEGVESAIKFARAFTKRDLIVFADGGFHGLTCGSLSLMSNHWWREGFGPLLLDAGSVPFGDLEALEAALRKKQAAAFICEPIQGECGVRLPPPGYWKEVAAICQRYGTLLVLDEVQSGMCRTGTFLASHQYDVEPDMVILAKALSGGHIPVSALLMRNDINRAVYSSVDKAFVHASTFSENSLAMRAGLATLDVLESEKLGDRARTLGERFRRELSALIGKYEMIKEVRGLGLFNAIEFQPPQSLSLKLLYGAFHKAHPGLFGQMFVKTLFEEAKILAQMAGHNYLVIKLIPPLMVSDAQLDQAINGVRRVLDMIENSKTHFWTQGLKIGAKALGA